ncbi:metalloregulator ArsR/SmtB family transcription factor [Jannaschia sp. S6380]|uniref:ArsR/SmtB family transcription factor n=1 Tax=Jannaschia sp. S6380 TaxID=2926408 RepID=UPI001FF0F564|nr:metalloregulator ArsR/SmtB family transcription factor [Jannaschia sp. S6380]MCK0166167.1 metalloregulator ArsR/SmtB family transcription factor [Jannaschia sp. S6380]
MLGYISLILCLLAEGEASAGALQDVVGLSQAALSQHLAKLRGGGVFATRCEAQTIHYRLADPQIEAVMAAPYDTFCRGVSRYSRWNGLHKTAGRR